MCTPAPRREALLAEFERSGLSGKQFAQLSGIKYSTFQYWLQCRKRKSGAPNAPAVPQGQQVAWLEAVVQQDMPCGSASLLLRLPGGAHAQVASPQQIHLAAALVRALEKPC
jgi:transposase